MRNIEIKAKVRDVSSLILKAKALSSTPEEIIHQHDTFYNSKTGRLKLRKYKDGSGDLVYYEREDSEGPKLSTYDKAFIPTSSVEVLNKILIKSLGEKGIVAKKRQLYMIGQTRVHIDSVVDLGDFMELEVMLKDDQTPEDGVNIAHDLMEKLGIDQTDLIAGAYQDLLEKNKTK